MRLLVLGLLALLATLPAARAAGVGDSVEGSLSIDGLSVPLPDGRWEVYYAKSSGEGYPRREVGLVLVEGRVVRQTVSALVVLAPRRDGFKPWRDCENAVYPVSEMALNRHGREQDCWHLRPVDLSRGDNPSERRRALFAYADRRSLFLPVAMIGARFHRADRDRALQVAYSWNADLILPSRAKEKLWVFQDWTRDSVDLDPRKQAVVDALAGWGREWHARVDESFRAAAGGS